MDKEALTAFYRRLDRSLFLDEEFKQYAKADCPLSIGYGQTISQPSLVLEMTELLLLEKNHKVLEIGTGSGYQTAFLAEFGQHVYTVEIIEELSLKAKERLDFLGYDNVDYKIGDGSQGWIEYVSYDRIIVTASAGRNPEKLIAQLAENGRMVIPMGDRYHQMLMLIIKDDSGKVHEESIMPVRFVEMVGDYGWDLH